MSQTVERPHHTHDDEPEIADYAHIDLRPLALPSDVETVAHDHLPERPAAFRRLSGLVSAQVDVLTVVEFLTRQQASPWAVLVVSFNDDTTPPTDLARYQQVFTAAGTGTMNVVDYFADMSHGLLDLSGTQVFGPFVLDRPRADYAGNTYPAPEGKINRNGVLDLARATATASGVDLSPFAGVVVCGTPQLDLCGWVGGAAALCDDLSLQPSLLGQEMGHGYGLDHSRIVGSDMDYQDPWDTMSTANAHMAVHPTYGSVGPGLNATNMALRGWLRSSRVHTVDLTRPAEETVTLRPLHRRGLPGTLAVSVLGYTVELRTRAGWDAGIPRSCVLVHRAEDNRSVLMRGTGGNPDLVAGDTFEIGGGDASHAFHVRVHVESIDEAAERAVVHVSYVPLHAPDVPQFLPDLDLTRIPVDGGLVVVGGRVHEVPPRGPARELVEALAGFLSAGDPVARTSALTGVLHSLGAAARDLEQVSHTPPGLERVLLG